MLFIAQPNDGMVSVTESPEDHEHYPIRLVLFVTKHGEPNPLTEHAYQTIEDANTDLDYMGQYYEDISLIMVRGCLPKEVGF